MHAMLALPPTPTPDLSQLDQADWQALALRLKHELEQRDLVLRQTQEQLQCLSQDNHYKAARITQLTHEIAILKRLRFGKKSERLAGEQGSLLDEAIDADLAAIELELQQLSSPPTPAARPSGTPKRQALPAQLPRTEIHHEPSSTECACGCQMQRMGQDVAEKLDYTPGSFAVERHIRGKWVCRQCERISQAPVPAQVIDKGIATSALLAHVLIAKYADHLPLYRQAQIYAREGVSMARSTLAEWVGICGVQLQPLVDALRQEVLSQPVLHADETPLQILQPGNPKPQRGYLWAYATGQFQEIKAVIYDCTQGRSGAYARAFLGDWQGSLVCDDYAGYKACFEQGITEVGCMAHARRKFHELHLAGKSALAAQALQSIQALYAIEQQAQQLQPEQRRQLRQEQAKPIADALHQWMLMHRDKVPGNSGISRALDYSLKRWAALTRYLDDGQLPIDNNWVENQMRPIALGRKNWLFAGSLRAGQRAAAVMSLIQSAKLNGLDPHAYLTDVLTRLPTHPNSRIQELLPHRWTAL